MHKILIRPDGFGTKISQSRFKLAIQLSRLLNVIRSNQRSYLRIEDNADPANRRDRLELVLYQGAILYETIITLFKHSRELKSLNTWLQEADRLRRIQNEHNNKNSFTNRYLKIVRNEILFHYDFSAIDKISDFYPLVDNIEFASSSTEKMIDLAFILSDEILINYLIDKIDEPILSENKWAFFEENLLNIAEDISELLYGLIINILSDYISIDTDK
jgi:hypothetical protein